MKQPKIKMFILSGGAQDLDDLYLSSMESVSEMITGDIGYMTDAEIEEDGLEYTLQIKLMTQKEIDELPDYEF